MIKYVIDTSAVHRFFQDPGLYPTWRSVIARGEVGIIPLIEFEICYSAQKAGDRVKLIGSLAKLFEYLTPGPEVYDTARSMQEALTAKGAHRCCSPVDLVLAATAHVEDLAVLHVDKDYETVARFCPSFKQVRLDTGQPL
ncbi:PIN domain-containing protein [Streptomyces sp. NPDC048664]|uniref:PIN domain-containing protein n=1 Tax=Streptomyces sp. NPDC048664 TaxID=3154505 RepID=UPI0034473307